MPKIKYQHFDFKPETLARIQQANAIITEYAAQGFDLTLRQLYYQFVARDLIPNKQQEYKKLGEVVNNARLAGLIDWDRITDRTRNLSELSAWGSPADIVEACATQFRTRRWDTQSHYVEVWIEKDALVGVIEGVCEELRVPYFSCRGYTSQSEVWGAGQRLIRKVKAGKQVVILHFGDHDPSGIDMTRDIRERLQLFMGSTASKLDVRRLALTMEQVEEHTPPPNPAKTTDARYAGYSALHGDESWELDALEPALLAGLIRTEVDELIDPEPWVESEQEERDARETLSLISTHFDDVEEHVRGLE